MRKLAALVLSFVLVMTTFICCAESSAAGGKQEYTGKLRPIVFEVPMEWKQQALTQEYNTLEVKFVDSESNLTMIQYACQDMVGDMKYLEGMRNAFSTENYTEDDIRKEYETALSDLTVEKTKLGNLDCFIVRGATYGYQMTLVLFFEKGYAHQLSLFEMDSSKLSEHEQVLFGVAETVRFSGQENSTREDAGANAGSENSEDKNNAFGTIGETVLFGSYDQDNNLLNGSEKIEWIVLDVKDGKSLLLSKYALDTKPYHHILSGITWAGSSLREWLNTEFLETAFNAKEAERLLTTHVANDGSQGFNTERSGGEDTEDQVFLLSYHEAFDLYLTDETARQCAPTDTAIVHGARASDMCFSYGRGTWAWWLRSPGSWENTVAAIKYDGTYKGNIDDLEFASYGRIAVRPAIWVMTESDQDNVQAGKDEPAEVSGGSGQMVRNEKLDAAFEANTLKLVPTEKTSAEYSFSNIEISEELNTFLKSTGLSETDLIAQFSNLQETDIRVFSLSPAGNSGLLMAQSTAFSFFNGECHPVYPSGSRSVQDIYSNLETYYQRYFTRKEVPVPSEGVIYSPSGRYAAIFNIQEMARGRYFMDPIIIDLASGQLILTATYPSDLKGDFGFVTAGAFSEDSQFFYYALRGPKGPDENRLFRFNILTGGTEECFRTELDCYLHPRMYQTVEQNLIVMQVPSIKGNAGLVKFFRRNGEWAMDAREFSLPYGYFTPAELFYSDSTGYAVVVGASSVKNSYCSAFQMISPDKDFDGIDRYYCIDMESEQIVSVSAEEFKEFIQMSVNGKEVFPYCGIANSALSPDGNYLMVNANSRKSPEKHLILIRLEDLAIRKIEVPDPQELLLPMIMSGNLCHVIEWSTNDLIITTVSGNGTYRIE